MRKRFILVGSAVLVIAGTLALRVSGGPPPNKFIGAEKCKNCHEAKGKGSQYSTWKAMKHAKAFEDLGTAEGKKAGKDKGVEDPQTSEKCLKCHQTAYGEPADRIVAGFDPKAGVQCESCHGPGANHVKARMASEEEVPAGQMEEIPEGEIIKVPGEETCRKCHNEESPYYKPFCFKGFEERIRHLDPRRKRTDAELKAMNCGGDCGTTHGK